MKFWEAMKAVDEGAKVRRVHWDSDEFIYNKNGMLYSDVDWEYAPFDLVPEWELYKEQPSGNSGELEELRKVQNRLDGLEDDLSRLTYKFNMLLETNRQLNNSVHLQLKDNSLHPDYIKDMEKGYVE
jgi:hypothetical protein